MKKFIVLSIIFWVIGATITILSLLLSLPNWAVAAGICFPGLPVLSLVFKYAGDMMGIAADKNKQPFSDNAWKRQNGFDVKGYNNSQNKAFQYLMLFLVCAPISLIVMPVAIIVLFVKDKRSIKKI
jgi:hypothetical protein